MARADGFWDARSPDTTHSWRRIALHTDEWRLSRRDTPNLSVNLIFCDYNYPWKVYSKITKR
jgi:hypothetical protein